MGPLTVVMHGSQAEAVKTRPATDYANALREDGLVFGTRVWTQKGYLPVESLQAGDHVITFDNGPQPIAAIYTATIPGASLPPHKAFVMRAPPMAFADQRPVRLLPNQEVLIESDRAELALGDPFALIPAVLLGGYRGLATERINEDFEVAMLTFRDEQIVRIEGGPWVACRAGADFSPFEVACSQSQPAAYQRPDALLLPILARAIVEEQGRAG